MKNKGKDLLYELLKSYGYVLSEDEHDVIYYSCSPNYNYCSDEKIAAITGIREKSVHYIHRRALRKLVDELLFMEL